MRAGYIDPATSRTYPLDVPRWRSDDGGPLMITPLPGIARADIDKGTRSLWRYRAALPLDIAPVSLGEGCTPLVERDWAGTRLRFKLEWFAPTGSFKDRGATVMVSYLKQCGIWSILEDSSGNGGAAISAFGAAAGVKVKILCPATTQPAKVAQMRAFGATVQLVPGPREECEHEAIRQSAQTFYASHNWQAFFLQGTKTLAYELWEDLGFRAPDNVIIPVGAGSNVLGCDLGFGELLAARQIAKLPRLFAAQPAHCSPIHATFQSGGEALVAGDWKPTVAEGTAIKKPVRLKLVLDALRRSGGGTAALTEDEIIDTTKRLASGGIYVEPTSASAACAAERLLDAGTIKPGETTVVVLTGTGLKASAFMTELFGRPVT
ncbi:MAG: pyridoxal-phosphate dependent enzyme [Alphaproteobacteria bacterium]|nr:pyridoxal-phosphate dependent enzyme [Alphaproteobacteria bacterium]